MADTDKVVEALDRHTQALNKSKETPTQKKPGIKTTEFWVAILGSLVIGLLDLFNIQLDEGTINSVITLIVSYIFSRLGLKGVETFSEKNKK